LNVRHKDEDVLIDGFNSSGWIFVFIQIENENCTNHALLPHKHGAFSVLCLDNAPLNEPRHDKTNIVGLRPAWIQTSLLIRAV
jgi:hypothetical protein